MGWSKLEFESPPKETCELPLCNTSMYYCLEGCITGGLLLCHRLNSKGLTNLSTKPVKNTKTKHYHIFLAPVSELFN